MKKITSLLVAIMLSLFCHESLNAQVGIGTTAPNADAQLDISSTNRGLLLPRVALTNTTNPAPLSADVAGMVVYNTATTGDVTPGFYYNDGAIWVRLGSGGATGNYWSLAGNAGTTAGTDFVGTTDNTDLGLARNSTEMVRLTNTVTSFRDEIQTRDGGTNSGDILVRMYDSNDDGILDIYRNNQVQHRLHGNGTTVFNERSANVDFRIESNAVNNAFFLEGSNGQITLGEYGAGGHTGTATRMLAVDVNGNIIEEPLTAGSTDWTVVGNAGLDGGNITVAGTNFIGTTDAQNIDFRTNNIYRGRFSSLGEFFVGTLNTVLPGDLMNAVSNATFPWAVNGYSDFDGAGTYGSVTSGTTIYGGVQGEYFGSAITGPGVRGITGTTSAGTDFDGNTVAGVVGVLGTGNLTNAFGLMGHVGGGATVNYNTRTGGVIGSDHYARGALGYYAANGNDYSAYGFGAGFQNGGAGGRSTNTSGLDTHIALGMYGGVMGGWIKGEVYGAMFSGDRFGSYVHGKSITNDAYVVLDKKSDGSKTATYASTSMSIDVQAKGMGKLANGTSYIPFDKDFANLIDSNKPIIVTVTPIGENNGIHLVSVDKNGFRIKENLNGNSNVQFNWVAIAEKANKKEQISEELLTAEFDQNTQGVMHNDDLDGGKALWYENGQVRFGNQAPFNKAKLTIAKRNGDMTRPKEKRK